MGYKENCLKRMAEARIQLLDDEVKGFFKNIINLIHKSNAYMVFKRRMYREIINITKARVFQKYTKAEDTVALLKEIDFLLPPKIEDDLEHLKKRLSERVMNIMDSQNIKKEDSNGISKE